MVLDHKVVQQKDKKRCVLRGGGRNEIFAKTIRVFFMVTAIVSAPLDGSSGFCENDI